MSLCSIGAELYESDCSMPSSSMIAVTYLEYTCTTTNLMTVTRQSI